MTLIPTDEQQQAVKMVKENKISVLYGAPGVGKTFTLKEILKWAKNKKLKIALAAPTGKAAKQMQISTGHQAGTIHKLLEPRMNLNGNFSFQKNEKNKLDIDLLIFDEVSMITNQLMADVFKAINIHKTKILLVGDFYQLPSVGAGAVLRDIINSKKVPYTELTEIQRNAGDIVRACHQIKDGNFYIPSKQLDLNEGLNLRHIEIRSPERIQQVIQQFVCERMPLRGYDPVWDVQVLSPVNKRTGLSCDELNQVLQAKLNKENPVIKNTIFRKNDKVIQTKNNKIKTPTGDEALVVNGDMGTVIEVRPDRNQLVVKFFNPDRTTVVPLNNNKLLLAYCVTCHRMQGSEAPVIIIPVHSGFNFFVDRAWLYTAISRAQEICITVGEFSAIKQAIQEEKVYCRKTLLKEKLQIKEK